MAVHPNGCVFIRQVGLATPHLVTFNTRFRRRCCPMRQLVTLSKDYANVSKHNARKCFNSRASLLRSQVADDVTVAEMNYN